MLIAKIKASILTLYPELGRLPSFKNLTATVNLRLAPWQRQFLRVLLPTFILVSLLALGVQIGTYFGAFGAKNNLSLTPVPTVVPITTTQYSSPYNSIKQEISDFNPSLPDPLYPAVDFRISLEPIVTPTPKF